MEQEDQNLSKRERQELKHEEKLSRQEQEKNKKRMTSIILWSFITLFVGGTIAAMIFLASRDKGQAPEFVGGSVKAADETDWVRGAPLKEAKITIIEYADFECPACGAYYPTMKKLEEDFKNVSFVYRHFPLPQHKNARPAAQAAQAAGEQGKFWEMHDLIFENQSIWSRSTSAEEIFTTYAERLGLDMVKYKTDLTSAKAKTKISADYQSGSNEVDGTPSFFLNNKKIQNPRNYEEFRSIIQQAGGTI